MKVKESRKQTYSVILHLLPAFCSSVLYFLHPFNFSFVPQCFPLMSSSYVTSRPVWKVNVDWCAICDHSSLSWCTLPFSNTAITCLSFEGQAIHSSVLLYLICTALLSEALSSHFVDVSSNRKWSLLDTPSDQELNSIIKKARGFSGCSYFEVIFFFF